MKCHKVSVYTEILSDPRSYIHLKENKSENNPQRCSAKAVILEKEGRAIPGNILTGEANIGISLPLCADAIKRLQ